ncbi:MULTISPECIES: RHS repeat-associated core domain-containing protein [unclassified Pseudomonas]|uniref:RHS repeat-associated core domain-containing protein n=3 Tax=Pseudomonas TaxID=286 RepID=UPI002AC9ECB7|nr:MULTISPECIES: RHS repeat-associated core domain-containing protein [unclassified Pseudomonas]MEB0121639.1 RHS repeat-associated core domain-containing protein [Pseudomonas sp. CCI1.2]WPX66228.1 RHS repeat-associated core domain-containing protein [Pseudomonas sp. MH10]
MTIHAFTPTLAIIEPRGLVVRSLDWYRSSETDVCLARVNRSAFDQAGRILKLWDARLWADASEDATAPANLAVVYSLSGQLLSSDSVDAGWQVGWFGEAGQLLDAWDGRGTWRRSEYDGLLRPTSIFEISHERVERCVERLVYGRAEVASVLHNQSGHLIQHDDQAGSQLIGEYGLTGSMLERTQHVSAELQPADWPSVGNENMWEPGVGATSTWRYSSLGNVVAQTDSLGNSQTYAHTVAGQLKSIAVRLKDQIRQPIVRGVSYDAQGRVESENLGNGVISTSRYREKDGRLIQHRAQRANGEVLQDLLYDYDPVGNVLRIEDRSQSTHFFANQKIEPVSTYQYDSLYQLIKATGWEAASINHGPIFPGFQTPPDPSQLANYVQTYTYDTAGNLRQLAHVGAQSHSSTLVTAHSSNRSLPQLGDKPPTEEDIAAGFDENGNVRQLQLGQTLEWDSRNQLQQVRPVVRESGNDDSERYIYDASGQRVRKVRITQARAVTHCCEVRYLPGLEIRTNTATGEVLHVITVRAGRSEVRVLHWQAGKSEGIDNDQYRYGLSDHLGSNTVELDREAKVISQEHYYPFGGTAWWAGRNAIEASYKAVSYSGKERDATGLYYYGLRYYAPWLQRWINPDPAGEADGLNRYRMVGNNPASRVDHEGLMQRPPPVADRPVSSLRCPGVPPPVPDRPAKMGREPFFTAQSSSHSSEKPNFHAPQVPSGLPAPYEDLSLGSKPLPLKNIRNVSSSYESWVVELSDTEWGVHKDFSSMTVLDAHGLAKQKIGAANEVFAYQFSKALNLNIVPATVIRPGTDREVISRYVDTIVGDVAFNRQQSSLYVFDFLLNTRDRLDDGRNGNIVFDKSKRAFAIDHDLILEPGFEAISESEITPDMLAVFASDPVTMKSLSETDWDLFFEKHISPEFIHQREEAKSEFLSRISCIKNRF